MKMDEEEKEEEEKQPEEDTGERDNPKSTELIDKANKAAERLERATEKKQEVLDKEEALMTRQALSGRASAGNQEEKPPEISNKEYAEKVLSGELNVKKE